MHACIDAASVVGVLSPDADDVAQFLSTPPGTFEDQPLDLPPILSGYKGKRYPVPETGVVAGSCSLALPPCPDHVCAADGGPFVLWCSFSWRPTCILVAIQLVCTGGMRVECAGGFLDATLNGYVTNSSWDSRGTWYDVSPPDPHPPTPPPSFRPLPRSRIVAKAHRHARFPPGLTDALHAASF